MVSVTEGQLTRTWFFSNQGRNHIISLYHDTLTGVRSAMLDFQEIRGSTGNSSLFMDSAGHRIIFTVDDLASYIEIKRSGWTGFSYACFVNETRINESTETVATDNEPVFSVKLVDNLVTPDEESIDYPVIWYLVRTTRLVDNAVTHVHRRFREFADLNSQVKQNFKGHHLRAVLPAFPEKTPKALVHYNDPDFVRERQLKLDHYLTQLIAIPHVSNMICVRAFLGMMDSVRELSIAFHVPSLGLTLQPQGGTAEGHNPTAVIVGMIQKPELCEGVRQGDSLSKINGLPIAGMSFSAVVHRIKSLPRPILVHFIQVMGPPRAVVSQHQPEGLSTVFASNAVSHQSHSKDETNPKEYVSLAVASSSEARESGSHLSQATRLKAMSIPDSLDNLDNQEPTPSAASDTNGEWNSYHSSADHSPIKNTSAILNKHSEALFGSAAATVDTQHQYNKGAFEGDEDTNL